MSAITGESVNLLKHPIMGISQAAAGQMTFFVTQVNPGFDSSLPAQFLSIGAKYGVRGDVAFCQSILETNWFRFGGDVRAAQNNFAGIGAVGGNRGAQFSTPQEGITAQIQHLFAYATTAPIPAGEKVVDPRFAYVNRGTAPYWEDLAGRWAVPGYDPKKYASLQMAYDAGETYGQQIMKIYGQLLALSQPQPSPGGDQPMQGYPANTPDWKKEGVEWLYEQGLLTDEQWKLKIDEPLPLWATALLLKRLYEKAKNT